MFKSLSELLLELYDRLTGPFWLFLYEKMARKGDGKQSPGKLEHNLEQLALALGLGERKFAEENDFLDLIEEAKKGGIIDHRSEYEEVHDLLSTCGIEMKAIADFEGYTFEYCEELAKREPRFRLFYTGSDYLVLIVVTPAQAPRVDVILRNFLADH